MSTKGWKKQFCVNGHDTFICGRYKDSACVECQKEYDARQYVAHPLPKVQFCPKGHDTFVTGRYKDGNCKECIKIAHREYNRINKDYFKQYREDHSKELIIVAKEYREKHPEVYRLSNLKQKTNRGLRAKISFGQDGVKEFFKNTPSNKVVDHYIPLLGEFVSGLNVRWNLQYLTKLENSKKSNKCDLMKAFNWYGKILEEAGLK